MASRVGMSLHIGVNQLNPAGYRHSPTRKKWPYGWIGPLKGCEFDAEAYEKIAAEQGFETEMLSTMDATAENVMAAVKRAADKLKAGDTFLITFAGHGGQIVDVSGDEAAESANEFVVDSLDETWCLHDRHFIDDEKTVMYLDFKPGVRILELNDSCHSGGMDRGADDEGEDDNVEVSRGQPGNTVHSCYAARKDEYDKIQMDIKDRAQEELKASYVLLTACEANELCGDGYPNGKFTGTVIKVWERWSNENVNGTYDDFIQEIKETLDGKNKALEEAHRGDSSNKKPIVQHPTIVKGKVEDDAFYNSRPFSIG